MTIHRFWLTLAFLVSQPCAHAVSSEETFRLHRFDLDNQLLSRDCGRVCFDPNRQFMDWFGSAESASAGGVPDRATDGSSPQALDVAGEKAVSSAVGAGDASNKPAKSSREVPFQQFQHLIVVKGSIGSLNDLSLVVDTGASLTVIGRQIAKKLHLRGRLVEVVSYGSKVRVEEVMIPELRMGSERFQSVNAFVGELPRLRGVRFDALVGLEVLKRTNLRIDFRTRTILFGPIIHTGVPIRFYRDLPMLLVPVRVGGHPLRLMLDSGAEAIILFGERVSDRVSVRRTRYTKWIQHTGGQLELPKVFISEFAMGQSQWRELSAFIMDGSLRGSQILDGILGLSPLNLKSLTIDFERALMSWEN